MSIIINHIQIFLNGFACQDSSHARCGFVYMDHNSIRTLPLKIRLFSLPVKRRRFRRSPPVAMISLHALPSFCVRLIFYKKCSRFNNPIGSYAITSMVVSITITPEYFRRSHFFSRNHNTKHHKLELNCTAGHEAPT